MAKRTEDKMAESHDGVETASKRMKVRNKTSSATKATPSFLGIPGELRNEIYDLLLHNLDDFEWPEDCYDVNTGREQPAILRVNRQIRREAMPIFDYNYFTLDIHNTKLEPHRDHWCWQRTNLEFKFDRYRNWYNLKDWLKRAYDGDLLPKQVFPSPSFDLYVQTEFQSDTLIQAFRIVNILEDVAWEKVEAILEAYVDGVNASAKYEYKIE